jgi:hypothetical protein
LNTFLLLIPRRHATTEVAKPYAEPTKDALPSLQ